MSNASTADNHIQPRPRPRWLRWLTSGENALVMFVLAGLVILPLTEVALRLLHRAGVAGSSAFVQHFTLLVGVLGGAIAARERRLLSLSSLPNLLAGHWKTAASLFSSGLASAISVVLCLAGWQFVQAEPADKMLAYGIPLRVFQLFLPVGFGLVALRLCWHASNRWSGRALTWMLAAALVWVALKSPIDP